MAEKLVAAAQYGDLRGTAAIDSSHGGDWHDVVKGLGVDTTQYFPVGIEVHGNRQALTVLAVKKSELGGSFAHIMDKAKERRSLPVTSVETDKTFQDFCARMKRVNIVLSSELVRELERVGIPVEKVDSITLPRGTA